MKCIIIIDGESAEELLAVGSKDLVSFFLPKALKIVKKDIQKCFFKEDSCIKDGVLVLRDIDEYVRKNAKNEHCNPKT